MSTMFNSNQENISTDGTSAAPASAYGYPTYPPVVGQMDWSQAQAMMAASMAWPGMNFNNQYAAGYPGKFSDWLIDCRFYCETWNH